MATAKTVRQDESDRRLRVDLPTQEDMVNLPSYREVLEAWMDDSSKIRQVDRWLLKSDDENTNYEVLLMLKRSGELLRARGEATMELDRMMAPVVLETELDRFLRSERVLRAYIMPLGNCPSARLSQTIIFVTALGELVLCDEYYVDDGYLAEMRAYNQKHDVDYGGYLGADDPEYYDLPDAESEGGHEHEWAEDWSHDDDGHWYECTGTGECGVKENSGKDDCLDEPETDGGEHDVSYCGSYGGPYEPGMEIGEREN